MSVNKMTVEPKKGGSKEYESPDQLPVKPAKPAPQKKKSTKKGDSSKGGNK